MANDSKNSKKAATKPAKVAGTHKVPKYEQREGVQTALLAKTEPKGKK